VTDFAWPLRLDPGEIIGRDSGIEHGVD
jgi:hypothetical protein